MKFILLNDLSSWRVVERMTEKNNLYKIIVNTIHYAYEGKCNETKNTE